MYRLNLETPEDWWEVENLFDTAFGPGRTGLSSYQLRQGADPVANLCFAARDGDGVLAGAVRHWAIRVGDGRALLLGPIAVHPTRQGEGLGAALMARALDEAARAGWCWVLLVGDAPYYERFGFSRAAAHDVAMPPPTNPDRVLARAIVADPPPLAGRARPWSEPG